MKNYNVKEIAELLSTNPETVRRWIRTGKLLEVQESKKVGNVVSEIDFQDFLKRTPKYASIVGAKSSLIPAVMMSTAAIVSVAAEIIGDSRPAEKNITIKTEKITREMQYAMQEMQKQVEEKKKTVEIIQKEIQDCEAKIVELKEAINKINNKDDVRKE